MTLNTKPKVTVKDVQRALRKERRCYEYGADGGSGFHVESCPTDDRIVLVTFKVADYTTFGDGLTKERAIETSLTLYSEILMEGFDYSTHLIGNTLLVGAHDNRVWPSMIAPKSSGLALAELRQVVESDGLDYYTRLTPGRNSIFVIKVVSEGVRRTEVFYDGDSGTYRAMPRFGTFGHVRSNDPAKVLEFLRDELGD